MIPFADLCQALDGYQRRQRGESVSDDESVPSPGMPEEAATVVVSPSQDFADEPTLPQPAAPAGIVTEVSGEIDASDFIVADNDIVN